MTTKNNNNSKTATNKAIVIVSITADTFAAAMGIDVTRERQICDLIEQCYEGTETYPKAIACLSQVVSNINELAYALFHLGAFAGNEMAKKQYIQLTQVDELETRLAAIKKGISEVKEQDNE